MKIIVQHSTWKWGDDYHLITDDGMAYVRLYFDNIEGENVICDLFVDEKHRKCGYATKLLNKCDDILNGRPVKVVPREDWLKNWYEKRGYEIVNYNNFE